MSNRNGLLLRWTAMMRGLSDGIEALMAANESVLVSIVGRVACWLTPIPSAILVSRAADAVFHLGPDWSWVMAAVIELLGIVTGNLWLNAKEWNATRNSKDPAANEVMASRLLWGYVIVAEALLIAFQVIDIWETHYYGGLVSLLFPFLSVVGQLALNERITQARRAQDKRSRRDATRPDSSDTVSRHDATVTTPAGGYAEFVAANAVRNGAGPMPATEIAARFGVSVRTGQRWIRRYEARR